MTDLVKQRLVEEFNAGLSGPKDPMLVHFSYDHLPLFLQEISKPFCDLARNVVDTVAPGPERTVTLRKLLEAKDAGVRARLNPGC